MTSIAVVSTAILAVSPRWLAMRYGSESAHSEKFTNVAKDSTDQVEEIEMRNMDSTDA
jgi:hypothetical protein